MTATVAQLGARALRKCGIAIVADAARPAAGATLTAQDVALRVTRELGIIVPEALRPASLGTVGSAELAQRVLRAVGVNPVGPTTNGDLTSVSGVAKQALRSLGVNPIAGFAADGPAVSLTVIAQRALHAVGVNPLTDSLTNSTAVVYTLAQMATQVLLKLAVIAPDETPSDANLGAARDRITDVHDMLLGLGYVTWPVSAVPAFAAEQYIIIAANLAAPYFGKPANMDAIAAAQEMMRQQAAAGVNAQVRTEARAQTVHDTLISLGLADWTLTAIPDAVADAYVTMTASLIGPIYGKPADPQGYDAAVAHIRRMVLSGVRGETIAEAQVGSVHDELVGYGLADWTLANIPTAVSDAYADMVQQELAEVYGQDGAPDRRLAAIERVRRYVLSGPRGQALAIGKVQAVHEELNAAGLVSWYIESVPLSVAEDYVQMGAVQMASVYRTLEPAEKQANGEIYAGAMDHVRQVGRIKDAEERALIKVRAAHEELNQIGSLGWDINAIPAAAAEAYVDMVSAMLSAEGGKPADPAMIDLQYKRIRRIAMSGPAGQALAEQKVRAVHYALDARGKTRWTLYDVPDYAEEPYVFLAAALLAPECGVPADPTWEPRAERDLLRIISMPSDRQPVRAVYF